MAAREEYTIQIRLPEAVETVFRAWAERTPGATWADWGGHVSLSTRFRTTASIADVERLLAALAERYEPFTLHLNRVVTRPHLVRPELHIVFLLPASTPDDDFVLLMRFQHELNNVLAPFKEDVYPTVSQRPFNPHLTLTLGLPEREAEQLAERARADGLALHFEVTAIWLLAFALGGHVLWQRAFPLGAADAPNDTARPVRAKL